MGGRFVRTVHLHGFAELVRFRAPRPADSVGGLEKSCAAGVNARTTVLAGRRLEIGVCCGSWARMAGLGAGLCIHADSATRAAAAGRRSWPDAGAHDHAGTAFGRCGDVVRTAPATL